LPRRWCRLNSIAGWGRLNPLAMMWALPILCKMWPAYTWYPPSRLLDIINPFTAQGSCTSLLHPLPLAQSSLDQFVGLVAAVVSPYPMASYVLGSETTIRVFAMLWQCVFCT
jgi:hypothetical protein